MIHGKSQTHHIVNALIPVSRSGFDNDKGTVHTVR